MARRDYMMILTARPQQLRSDEPPPTCEPEPDDQAPPDREILLGSILIFAIGANRGPYQADTEYYYDNGQPMEAGAVTLSVTDISDVKVYTEDALDRIASAYTRRFSHERVVTRKAWRDHAVSPYGPDKITNTNRLYAFEDPDDKTASIGVLTEQAPAASGNALVAFTWYKTTQPDNGQVWTASPPSTSTAKLVTDSGGTASTRIGDVITPTGSWYYFLHS